MLRLKRYLKWTAVVVGSLIATLLIANAVFVWQTGRRLEERLSKLRAAGAPLSLAEVGAMPVAPGADAAAVLKRIEPDIQALSKELAPITDRSPEREPTEDEWKTIAATIAKYPTVMPALQEAAASPSYKSPLNYHVARMPDFLEESLPLVQDQRRTANILKCHARAHLQRKDGDGAMRTCLTALRLSRHAENEPLMISYLFAIAVRSVAVGTANEILRAGPVADELHAELDAELAKFESSDGLRRCLQTERAFGLQAIDELNFGGWFSRGYNNDEKCFYLDQIEGWAGLSDSPYAEIHAYARNLTADNSLRHKLSKLVAPAFVGVAEAHFRSRCQVRCLRVLNALSRKKLADAPATLNELGLPKSATTDPFTEKPLIVKRANRQWLIYGLGKNLQDDGGQFDKQEDVGLGPVKPK